MTVCTRVGQQWRRWWGGGDVIVMIVWFLWWAKWQRDCTDVTDATRIMIWREGLPNHRNVEVLLCRPRHAHLRNFPFRPNSVCVKSCLRSKCSSNVSLDTVCDALILASPISCWDNSWQWTDRLLPRHMKYLPLFWIFVRDCTLMFSDTFHVHEAHRRTCRHHPLEISGKESRFWIQYTNICFWCMRQVACDECVQRTESTWWFEEQLRVDQWGGHTRLIREDGSFVTRTRVASSKREREQENCVCMKLSHIASTIKVVDSDNDGGWVGNGFLCASLIEMWNQKDDDLIRSVRSMYKYINDDTYDICDVQRILSSQFSHHETWSRTTKLHRQSVSKI